MKYLFLPLSQHCDDGLGATAEAFEDSAKLLINNAAEISHCHYKYLSVTFTGTLLNFT
jgi:hypothetical protein